MTFISENRARELAEPTKPQIIKPTANDKIEAEPKTTVTSVKDKVSISENNKSETSIVPLFEDSINDKIDDIKKGIENGKTVHINYAQFPGMTKEQIVQKIFPDAVKIKTDMEFQHTNSTYETKESGKLSVDERFGCFGPSTGFSIAKAKKSEVTEIIEISGKIEEPIHPKLTLPSISEIIKENAKVSSALNELDSKGKVFLSNKEFTGDTNSIIEKLFPGSKISASEYSRPFVNTRFSDKDGNHYEVNNLVDGFVASNGITIKKL